MVVANSHGLGLDETTMLKLRRYIVERLKVNHIIFFLCVFDMGYHEGLWVGIYKGVEVQEVKMMN